MLNVAMNDNGQYVAVWNSDGQDGDGFGIFAQNGTVVPEPTSISLMLAGGLTLLAVFMRRNTGRRGEV